MEVAAVKGFWLIFALFPPCLVYALLKHRAQTAEQQQADAVKKAK